MGWRRGISAAKLSVAKPPSCVFNRLWLRVAWLGQAYTFGGYLVGGYFIWSAAILFFFDLVGGYFIWSAAMFPVMSYVAGGEVGWVDGRARRQTVRVC